MRVALAAVSLLCLTACPPAGVRGTARTLPRGESLLFAAVGATLVDRNEYDENAQPVRRTVVEAAYDVGFSYGILEGLEGGLSLYSGGSPYAPSAAGTLKWRPLSPEVWGLPVHVAIAPRISFPAAYLELPLLVGIDVAGDDELLFTSRVLWRSSDVFTQNDDRAVPAFFGASVGYAFRFGETGLMVKPEVGALYAFRHVSELLIGTPRAIALAGEWRWVAMVEVSSWPRARK